MEAMQDQLFELLTEIEAFASVTHCSLDAPPNSKHLKIMMEMIINTTRTAKSIMA